jgi:hypothetical protein
MSRSKMFAVALTILIGMSASGCSLVSKRQRGLAIAADIAVASGALLVVNGLSCSENDLSCLGPRMGAAYLGVPLLIGGAAMEIGAFAANVAAPDQVTGWTPAPTTPVATTGRLVVEDRLPALPALPEIAVDTATLELAKQARTESMRGRCDALAPIIDAIRARDPQYVDALAASPALAGCRGS